jgi:hypothetical protein
MMDSVQGLAHLDYSEKAYHAGTIKPSALDGTLSRSSKIRSFLKRKGKDNNFL